MHLFSSCHSSHFSNYFFCVLWKLGLEFLIMTVKGGELKVGVCMDLKQSGYWEHLRWTSRPGNSEELSGPLIHTQTSNVPAVHGQPQLEPQPKPGLCSISFKGSIGSKPKHPKSRLYVFLPRVSKPQLYKWLRPFHYLCDVMVEGSRREASTALVTPARL